MSSPCHTSSPHEHCLAKTKAPKEHMEEEWKLVSAGEEVEGGGMEGGASMEEAANKAQEEAERKAEEECKVQEEAVRVKEEAKRLAKEATAREEAAKRAAEAMEERADAKRRALEEQLWETAGQHTPACRASGVQDPCTQCCNKGTLCVLDATKGKTTACEACCHTKVSCSWLKKMVGESRKQKWVQRSEEVEEIEVINVDKDEDKEWPHFVVPQHLVEEHQDTLGTLMTTLDTLSTDFLKFWQDLWNLGVATLRAMETIANELWRANDLKEEEMGRSKGKGKEKAQEEFRRARTEDDDGDMEMGGAGPSLLA
ncbi:hypothetical protein ID866_11607 [Astraeus odoratus]|nr:hypothetical protein ID866_11607 [Astraeus odoratus]